MNTTKVLDQYISEKFTVYHSDNSECIDGLPDNSVDLVVTSIPFESMYTYMNTERDIGNCKNSDEFFRHLGFLFGENKLRRVVKPGRTICIHLTQKPIFKHTAGYVGRNDFRGDVIRFMQSHGWIYTSEVLIDKDPQMRAVRSKDRGLLFKSLSIDSSVMAPVVADYLTIFRSPGENIAPILAGQSAKYGNENGWISEQEWIEWARPVWYKYDKETRKGIRETDVLNTAIAREGNDERHLCPLQLGVIERCIKLWSAPGEIVLDPFSGVGSTGWEAIKLDRKYIGMELKKQYYDISIRYLKRAESESGTKGTLFELFGKENEPEEKPEEIEEPDAIDEIGG